MRLFKVVFVVLLALLPGVVFGGGPAPQSVGVPTLSEWGAVASAAVLCAAGAYAMLRRK